MKAFVVKFRLLFFHAALFSFCINILQLSVPLYFMQVFDRVMLSRSDATLILLTVAITGALVVMSLFELLRSRLLIRVGAVLDTLLGRAVLSELMRRATRPGKGPPPAGSMRDIASLRQFFAGPAMFALFDAPWVPISCAIIFFFSWSLGIIAVLGLAVLFGLGVLEERLARAALDEANVAAGEAAQFVSHSLRNAEAVGAMGMNAAVVARWSVLNQHMVVQQSTASHRAAAVVAASKFVRLFLQVLMMAVGVFLVIDANVTPGVMLASTLILSRALAPVEMAIASWKMLIDGRDAYRRIDAVLAAASDCSGFELPAPKGELVLERLVFARDQHYILKGITFQLKAGASLGIVGPSGAGKSSLARLLVGAMAASAGSVRLDGADITQCNPDWLGRFVGYLPQDIELFPASVAENIARLGDAGAQSEQVVMAAQKAGAHQMILGLPQGYDTPLGRSGIQLSGGQIQRIALARALFGNPRLVVLDEPNSNLDSEGEDALLAAFEQLRREGVTLVVITHKPSLLGGFEQILLLREGCVELLGPRQEVFARLVPTAVPSAVTRHG